METFSLSSFQMSQSEQGSLTFFLKCYGYLPGKACITDIDIFGNIKSQCIKDKLPTSCCHEPSITEVAYLGIVNKPADNKVTIQQVLANIKSNVLEDLHLDHLVVGGDGKTYDYLLKVKQENPSQFEWLIPFLGCFHLMKVIQKSIMCMYWDAGLKEVAASISRSSAVSSIEKCASFRRTHTSFRSHGRHLA